MVGKIYFLIILVHILCHKKCIDILYEHCIKNWVNDIVYEHCIKKLGNLNDIVYEHWKKKLGK